MNDAAPNLPLLRKILSHIDAHPDEWYQKFWARRAVAESSCGTAFCIAGHAVVMAGGLPRWTGDQASNVTMPDGTSASINAAAAHLLGLKMEDADQLFHPSNLRADVQDIAEDIARRAGETL